MVNNPASSYGPVEGFRPDLQGLRAVAVIAVVLYHCGFGLFSGGYVGVDMFFALSGFLMTALLVQEKESNSTISFRAFYARRIRRLLPASVTVLLVTAFVSWMVMYPLEMREVTTQLAAAGAYVVNMLFAREGSDYLGTDVAASPVLHYWSLAVEEQFYLLWPLVVLLLAGRKRTHTKRSHANGVDMNRIRIGLGVVTVSSFVAAVVITHRSQPWAFYGLHTRAWEFAIGGMAAVAWHPLRRFVNRFQIAVGFIAMTALVATIVAFDGRTVFPGPWAALPVLATSALILVGTGPGPLTGLLRSTPMQWVGDRSYSFYLWHWPAIVLVPKIIGRTIGPWGNLVVVAGSGVIAAVTYELLEQPLRFYKPFRTPRIVFRFGAVLTAVAVLIPVAMGAAVTTSPRGTQAQAVYQASDDGTSVVMPDMTKPNPIPSNLEPSLDTSGKSTPAVYENGCHVGLLRTTPKEPCRFGDTTSRYVVVLFGDSHAAQWFPALEKVAQDNGWALVSFTKSDCPSSDLTLWNDTLNRRYVECDLWRRNVIRRIDEMQPDVVIMANRSRHDEDLGGFSADELASATAATIRDLAPSKARIVEIGPIPHLDEKPADCLSGNLEDANDCSLTRSDALPGVLVSEERESTLAEQAGFIDPTPWLCSAHRCPVVIGQYLVYRDSSHLSEEYAEWLSGPLKVSLDAELSR